MTGSESKYLHLLWLAEKLAPVGQRKALRYLEDREFFDRTKGDWIGLGLSEDEAANITDQKQREGLGDRLRKLKREGIRILTSGDGDFPFTLPLGDKLPPILFMRGNGQGWRREGLAVVGSRKPTAYGLEVAGAVAREAAFRGIPVISGAALGIDTAAHEGALEAGGATVAVLGSGLFHIYPPKAGPLLDRISERGAVISQFPPQKKPDKTTFPVRNHLIAAFSSGVVVVEGAGNSGARHTARAAKDMNIQLFAVPGDITRPQSSLPNRLLAAGALPVTTPADPSDPLAMKSGAQGELFPKKNAAASEKKGMMMEIPEDLPEFPGRIVALIREGANQIDELQAKTGADHGKLNEALLDLEIRGLVRQSAGRSYTATLSGGK